MTEHLEPTQGTNTVIAPSVDAILRASPAPPLYLAAEAVTGQSVALCANPSASISAPKSLAESVALALAPTVDILKEFVGRFMDGILDVLAFAGVAIDEGYTQLEIFCQLCIRYNWCLTPDFSLAALLNTASHVNGAARPQHRIYTAFRDHFMADDWYELRALIDRLGPNFAPQRKKILLDCIQALRTHGQKRFNAANLVVPTCITIIDGMLSEFAHDRGIKNWHNRKNGGFATLRAEIESVTFAFDKPAIALIFDTLFSRAFYSDTVPESGRRFNRHKIEHGNWLEYGRLEYVLRLFLMIRFLDYIIEEYYWRLETGSSEPVTDASRYSQMLSKNPIAPIRDMLRQRLAAKATPLDAARFRALEVAPPS